MESTENEDETGWNCSVHPSVFFLLGTLLLTTCATGMLCGAIMTDHWEEVTWDRDLLNEMANESVHFLWHLDDTVAKVIDARDKVLGFLVPMHGGIWTLCVNLQEKDIEILQKTDYPQMSQCVNYLSGGSDGFKNYEPRADWQHSK